MPPYTPQEIRNTWTRVLKRHPRGTITGSAVMDRLMWKKIGQGVPARWMGNNKEEMTRHLSRDVWSAFEDGNEYAVDPHAASVWLWALPYLISDLGSMHVWERGYKGLLQYYIDKPQAAISWTKNPAGRHTAVEVIWMIDWMREYYQWFTDYLVNWKDNVSGSFEHRDYASGDRILDDYAIDLAHRIEALGIRATASIMNHSSRIGVRTEVDQQRIDVDRKQRNYVLTMLDALREGGRVPFLFANLGNFLGEWNRFRGLKGDFKPYYHLLQEMLWIMIDASRDLGSKGQGTAWQYRCYDLSEFLWSAMWADHIKATVAYDLARMGPIPSTAPQGSLLSVMESCNNLAGELDIRNRAWMQAWNVPNDLISYIYAMQPFDLNDGYPY